MVDPTAEQLNTLNTLNDVLDWCGVVNVPPADPDPGVPFRTDFLAALGKPQLVREIVLIKRKAYTDGIAKHFTAEPLTPVQEARTVSVRRVCRLRCGLDAEDPVDFPPLPPPPPADSAMQGAAAPSTALVPYTGRKLKLSSVVDQALEGEVQPISALETRKLFEDYETNRGAQPHKDIEPTGDQLAAVKQLVQEDTVPYVDFAVYGPYGRRMLRKLVFVSWIMSAAGEWSKKELPGPPDFSSWWRSWRLLKTTFLLLQIATTEVLDNYGEFIRSLSERYGPRCWWIVYLGETRMRSEQFERIRRRCEKEHADAILAGRPSSFRPAAPWDMVFQEAVRDRDFWDEEVREKCVFFMSSIKTVSELQDDETNVSLPAPARFQTPEKQQQPSRMQSTGQPSAKRQKNQQSKEFPDLSQKDSSGNFTHNRRGNELCNRFNGGDCNAMPCPNNYRHQCSKCLGQHPASQCGGQSKGKGKGKRGGKRR